MSTTSGAPEIAAPDACSVVVETLTFPDGTALSLSKDEIVVFVGPNNAGKSVALREIQGLIHQTTAQQPPGVVISSGRVRKVGSLDDLIGFLDRNFHVSGSGLSRTYTSFGHGISVQGCRNAWSSPYVGQLGHLFCFLAKTEIRITDSDPTNSAPYVDNAPNHPLASLYVHDELEARLSETFRQAFGVDLIVFRLGGSTIPLLVGDRPQLEGEEDRLSISYVTRLKEQTSQLTKQGDGMRSFATVLLRTLVTDAFSVVLLDEPEAFLHPPQARLLGETLARQKPSGRQLFIATHSDDILQGLLSAAPGKLRIVRLQRAGDVTRVKQLDRKIAEDISRDPLMRFSSILSGVFHKRVVICEADADCMFYKTLFDLPSVHRAQIPDALFVQSNGKHRMKKLARVLRSLDVPVDVIADIDVLNDLSVLEGLIESLGGDWSVIGVLAARVKVAVESGSKWLDGSAVNTQIRQVLSRPQSPGAFPSAMREEILSIMGKSSPWDAIKAAGAAAVPSGETSKTFKELLSVCSKVGLWIVPVGEMEGFCRTEGGHGPIWVQRVLSTYEPAASSELKEARDFVQAITERVPS